VTELLTTVGTDQVRVTGLGKSYGPLRVLDGVDLAVPAGALTAVLGPSGCGKTTLLRLIAGFDRPDSGTVTIGGREVAGPGFALAPEDRRIGYVTQEGNLFPHLTVAANITFGLPRRDRRARARVAELLELVGLEPAHARRRPDELSGGQQQRVALARALAPRPGVLLLDEPFSSLDSELRQATRRAVATALEVSGTTTVLVTHDQAEALSMAGRIAVMRDGRIVQEAAPAELYRNPVDRTVAGFVGDVVALPATVRGGLAECALGSLELAGARTDGPATVLVRPEQIHLDSEDGVSAEVTGFEYYGHDAIVRLALIGPDGAGSDGAGSCNGDRPGGGAGTVVARCPGHRLPAVGDRVRLTVHGPVAATD
jgi:iron(III) transport system ATP-binding protein